MVLSLILTCILCATPATAKAAEEETTERVVRVGSFEDTFNYVNEKGARKGYGYELLETLSGYTGWKFEYVTCDWSNCFEKLINGEFDIMGDISYTEERAKQMLFSDEPMGEEKYYLYADLSDTDISAYNFQTLNGKRIGVPTYSGTLLLNVNSASPIGLERKDPVSPDGISSSVVVTGSVIYAHTFKSIWSFSSGSSGQSLIFGP